MQIFNSDICPSGKVRIENITSSKISMNDETKAFLKPPFFSVEQVHAYTQACACACFKLHPSIACTFFQLRVHFSHSSQMLEFFAC